MKSGSLRTHQSEGVWVGWCLPQWARNGHLHICYWLGVQEAPKAARSPQKKQLQETAVPVQLHSPLPALAQDICREASCGQRCQPAARVLPSPGCAQGANTVHLHHPGQCCTGKWPQASNVSLCKAEFMLCLCGMTGWETSPPGRRGKWQY